MNGRDTGSSDRRKSISVEAAIRNDPKLEQVQKDALIAVYRSYVPTP